MSNHEVNATGTLVLLTAAKKAGVKRFVHVSSSEVYGTARYAPMDENHPCLPETVYGAAKLAGVASMVQLFDQIGIGQWFRIVTGIVEIVGAVALVYPGLATLGGLWLGGTMVVAVAIQIILHATPLPPIIFGLANAVIVYLRRDELRAFRAMRQAPHQNCECK